MASKRRGGFRPPELRGTLGTLIRTTTGVVRDALERGAREGRARLDVARASLESSRTSHRRHDLLADLGELILDLIRRGEIDLAELPEARDLVRELDQIDEDAAAADLDAEPDIPRALSRRPFDDRPARRDSSSDSRPRRRGAESASDTDSRRHHDADDSDSRPRRRDPDDDGPRRADSDDHRRPRAASDGDRRRRRDSDDGTVSSGAVWRPSLANRPSATDRPERATVPDRPRPAETNSSRAPTKPMKGIWRPQIDDAPPIPDSRDRSHDRTSRDRSDRAERTERPDHDTERDPADRHARDTEGEPADRYGRDTERDRPDPADRSDHSDRRPSFPRDPTRKGGISFDDEDLADYMHPDDVPPKTPPKDPDDHEA